MGLMRSQSAACSTPHLQARLCHAFFEHTLIVHWPLGLQPLTTGSPWPCRWQRSSRMSLKEGLSIPSAAATPCTSATSPGDIGPKGLACLALTAPLLVTCWCEPRKWHAHTSPCRTATGAKASGSLQK